MSEYRKKRACDAEIPHYNPDAVDLAIRHTRRLGSQATHCADIDGLRNRDLVDVLGSAPDVERTRELRGTYQYRDRQKRSP
jgi:hypothetical protein